MGLFGLFKKKTDYFDKKIEPKCAYCEHGQPGRSNKMILCTKCGIVNEDYSCKKFTYSPLKRIPDRAHPSPDPSLTQKEASAPKAEVKPVEVKLTEGIPEKPEAKETVLTVNKTPDTAENTVATSEAPKADTTVLKDEAKPVQNSTEPKEIEKSNSVSDIHNTPQGNNENIKKLEEITQPQLSGIANTVTPKEIILPEVGNDAVSSISNSPSVRNSEEYLKSVSEQVVSEFENTGTTTHKLPENTKMQTLSDIK